MNRRFLFEFLHDNWYLAAAFVVCVVLVVYKAATPNPEQPPALVATRQAVSNTRTSSQTENTYENQIKKDALQTINAHRKRLDAQTNPEEAPVLLAAMGNLYRNKLSDYRQAAFCYERIIQDYPESPQCTDAFLGLATCYEQMGEVLKCNETLWKMMKAYPETSQEYAYARAKLEGRTP